MPTFSTARRAPDGPGEAIRRARQEGTGPMTTTAIDTLRPAYTFFREHAGGIVGESARGALDLARAEARLREDIDAGRARITFELEQEAWSSFGPVSDGSHDMDSWRAWWESRIESGALVVGTVLLETLCSECDEWTVSDALGGIDCTGEDDPYIRTVTAELAAEHYHEENDR